MHKYKTLIFTHYITYLSFQLLRNHRILQHINYSFLYLTPCENTSHAQRYRFFTRPDVKTGLP
jgi:hypothetical protein